MPLRENVEPEALPEVTITASLLLCKENRKTDEFLDLVQKKTSTRDSEESKGPRGTHNFSEYFSVKNIPILNNQQKITHLKG
ncbi:14235_t:CDS:2, partial [Racocetra fulgida]